MGILNITPDSFSDGGLYHDLSQAIDRTAIMIQEGADIIDVGGESTRPGAHPIDAEEEILRVIPVIAAIRKRFDITISIDTSKAEVMRQALHAGADMINDVYALSQPGSLAVVAASHVPVCLMHMQGRPKTMQLNPVYTDVVDTVKNFLQQRINTCIQAGIAQERIILDPGIGFGKTLQHNLTLLKNISKLHMLGCPLLIGFSRKRMLTQILASYGYSKAEQRLYGGMAMTAWSAVQKIGIIRTHDVAATKAVLISMQAVATDDAV